MIAEVILYSEGFEDSRNLARKMTQMYKLCSEQLSQQDHYDFGMRAVKSVLVMAGALKRGNPDLGEDIVLIRALRDSNLPKFLSDDALLFKVIHPVFSNTPWYIIAASQYGRHRLFRVSPLGQPTDLYCQQQRSKSQQGTLSWGELGPYSESKKQNSDID